MSAAFFGKFLGDPWQCGRCASIGSRAVLAVDRTPGCRVCAHTDGMDLLTLYYGHALSRMADSLSPLKTPFVSRL